MKEVRACLDRFCRRLDRFSLRERLLLFLASGTVVTLLWYTLLIEPLHGRRQDQTEQAAAAAAVVSALEQEAAAVVAAGRVDPDAEVLRQVENLQNEVSQLDARLEAMTGELISPQEMVPVLEDMLKLRRKLILTRLENLPGEPLLDPAEQNAAGEKKPFLNLYRHALRIELSGSYLEALAYLQSLEQLPRRIFWQDLSISVEDHPRARIRLTVYTLSLKEGWIGV